MTQVRRYQLTKDRFAQVRDLLPQNGRQGGPCKDHRAIRNSIFGIVPTEAQ